MRGVIKTFAGSGDSASEVGGGGGDGTVVALENINLRIDEGEFICLLGPSGCGKTTLLSILAGLEKPDAGRVLLGNRPVTGPGRERGMVFQEYALFPWRTVRKNIEFGLEIQAVPRRLRQMVVDRYIRLIGLEGFAEAYPYQLSGGMKQRVAIARALVLEPEILLLDEPFGALDTFTRMRLQDEVVRLWEKEGRTFVFVTHDIDEAIFLSDRVVLMTPRPGRIAGVVRVILPRPRQRNGAGFLAMRQQIYRELGLGYGADPGRDLAAGVPEAASQAAGAQTAYTQAAARAALSAEAGGLEAGAAGGFATGNMGNWGN